MKLDPEAVARWEALWAGGEHSQWQPGSWQREVAQQPVQPLAPLKIVSAGGEARARCELPFTFLKYLLRKVSQREWAPMPRWRLAHWAGRLPQSSPVWGRLLCCPKAALLRGVLTIHHASLPVLLFAAASPSSTAHTAHTAHTVPGQFRPHFLPGWKDKRVPC